MALITLAMPVYNAEGYIERALLSALNQTYPDIDYLIVDDKGTDRSIDIVKNIISKHPRGKQVRIVEHSVNLGAGKARDTAIDRAQGEYICFLDSDDEITPDCVQTLYGEMQQTGADVVFASWEWVCDGVHKQAHIYNHTCCNQKEEVIMSCFDGRKYLLTCWNKLYNLSFLREHHIRCRHHRIAEDIFFSFQVLLNARSYCSIPNLCEAWKHVFKEQYEYLAKYPASTALRVKIKKKLFFTRQYVAYNALKSPYNVQHYINDYFSSELLRDKDTLRSPILLLAYIFSTMPFFIKKQGVFFLAFIKRLVKKRHV